MSEKSTLNLWTEGEYCSKSGFGILSQAGLFIFYLVVFGWSSPLTITLKVDGFLIRAIKVDLSSVNC